MQAHYRDPAETPRSLAACMSPSEYNLHAKLEASPSSRCSVVCSQDSAGEQGTPCLQGSKH